MRATIFVADYPWEMCSPLRKAASFILSMVSKDDDAKVAIGSRFNLKL